jgi:hypothetical protein
MNPPRVKIAWKGCCKFRELSMLPGPSKLPTIVKWRSSRAAGGQNAPHTPRPRASRQVSRWRVLPHQEGGSGGFAGRLAPAGIPVNRPGIDLSRSHAARIKVYGASEIVHLAAIVRVNINSSDHPIVASRIVVHPRS